MKNALAITFLILACSAGIFVKLISTPGTETGRWFDEEACPAIKHTSREAIRKIPFIGLLDWDGVNDYQPRPTLRPLGVVPATATPYTAEELAEIYPTH